ncbi:HNH endonuclease signature motif containing protein [Shouchella clausii]|uniref:HNH endonuclease signature motif containing protein n=1 Tax=Shouchella clausii TaxID=79880 RepID=UPI000BA5F063|nr:HNH endonuclease [Shouchella clausii]PAD17369.1 hypothetical protein CHH74_02060 [Shouchella clausii]
MFKKILALVFLLAIVTTSTIMLSTSAALAEVIERSIVHDEETGNTTINETIVLEVDENGVAKESFEPFNTESNIIEQARNQFDADLSEETIEHFDFASAQEDVVQLAPLEEFEKSENIDDVKAQSGYGFIRIKTTIDFNATDKTITYGTSIAELIGNRPVVVITGGSLYSSNSYNGKYSRVSHYTKEFTGAQIRIGASYKKSYKVPSSKYFMVDYVSTTGWVGAAPITKQYSTDPFLTNKKAVLYPQYYNSHNKRYMPAPARADMKVVPADKRTERDKNIRDKYIKWYIGQYGDPKISWKAYDLHHVIPLEYGGTNAMNNLFHLPRDFHQKKVTPWWNAY